MIRPLHLRMNLAKLGEDNVATFGEYPALVFEGRELTNVDQQRAASRLAHALRRLGVAPGDRVVVMLPNCPEVLQAYAGILKAGAVVVPVVFLLGPHEVRHILAHSEARVVITSPDLADRAEGFTGTVILVGGAAPGALAWEELIAREPDRFEAVERDDGDLAVILYTAGTTGQPKGVALSHRNLAANARAAAGLYELDRERWALAVLPLSHSYGLMLANASAILGTRAVLLRWFNPEAVLETIDRYRVQQMAGVPTMYVYLLNYPEADRFDTSSMRVWGSGAAPLPVEIVEPFERKFGGRIQEGYGLTEASPVVSAHRTSGERRLGSVGQPIPGVEVRIVDDEDRPLPAGQVGEVCVRGENVMLGYYKMPEETARTVRAGWLHTGDMGRLDADGFLYIVERKKDLVIRGGFNIYPREVEEVLYAHPRVAEAAVVGAPDPVMGEEVVAFVVLKPGQAATAEEVTSFCEERLARFKCPKQVRFVDALPKSPVGKILRKELRGLTR
ncbi:MAG TPA: long-chain fatty acid--CoA ligase [Methylomirabilota bacterium]|nr:long-chain fatty acid--CoA ligase [Methylomirabilota bacterium]